MSGTSKLAIYFLFLSERMYILRHCNAEFPTAAYTSLLSFLFMATAAALFAWEYAR